MLKSTAPTVQYKAVEFQINNQNTEAVEFEILKSYLFKRFFYIFSCFSEIAVFMSQMCMEYSRVPVTKDLKFLYKPKIPW